MSNRESDGAKDDSAINQPPRYCGTEGCYRQPDVCVFIPLSVATASGDPKDDECRWKCSPCKAAMTEGCDVPNTSFEVVARAE